MEGTTERVGIPVDAALTALTLQRNEDKFTCRRHLYIDMQIIHVLRVHSGGRRGSWASRDTSLQGHRRGNYYLNCVAYSYEDAASWLVAYLFLWLIVTLIVRPLAFELLLVP